jgi:hypothetical protein
VIAEVNAGPGFDAAVEVRHPGADTRKYGLVPEPEEGAAVSV